MSFQTEIGQLSRVPHRCRWITSTRGQSASPGSSTSTAERDRTEIIPRHGSVLPEIPTQSSNHASATASANMLMLGQRWPNVCSYVGSTSHTNVGSTLCCSLGLRWPYRWRQPFANLQSMLIQRWPNVIQYEITLGQR